MQSLGWRLPVVTSLIDTKFQLPPSSAPASRSASQPCTVTATALLLGCSNCLTAVGRYWTALLLLPDQEDILMLMDLAENLVEPEAALGRHWGLFIFL